MSSDPLLGLVLAGGASRRMGQDKGSLRYHDEPQAVHAWRLLTELCGSAWVSTNVRNADREPYSGLPLLLDEGEYRGPIAGLEAAWRTRPEAAWLALAIDMPLADRPLLQFLIDHRNADALATAFLHEDGTIEPLCAIWEPAARQPLLEQLRRGDASLRRFLSRGNVECLVCPTPEKLRNANDIAAYRELLDGLGT
jgi:molybdopterin-guanine dinucleotide biosynthesis protein A